uniref:Uncharacterized protein n=1 Tax=Proboscia inermis TaxID=420281 RepID=A0A7S0C5G3_9STRA|mmetsp:Transcript_26898/g.27278  ORF Transcript_26898/g.27278 Transcript_26898/m.27278 type:complete len:165 (+) Transcript_26898:37-531(+)
MAQVGELGCHETLGFVSCQTLTIHLLLHLIIVQGQQMVLGLGSGSSTRRATVSTSPLRKNVAAIFGGRFDFAGLDASHFRWFGGWIVVAGLDALHWWRCSWIAGAMVVVAEDVGVVIVAVVALSATVQSWTIVILPWLVGEFGTELFSRRDAFVRGQCCHGVVR